MELSALAGAESTCSSWLIVAGCGGLLCLLASPERAPRIVVHVKSSLPFRGYQMLDFLFGSRQPRPALKGVLGLNLACSFCQYGHLEGPSHLGGCLACLLNRESQEKPWQHLLHECGPAVPQPPGAFEPASVAARSTIAFRSLLT